MNKKVIVIVALGGIQNAQASLFEMLTNLPGIKKICAVLISNTKRKSIMPATQETSSKEKKLIKKEFAQQRHEATNANCLKISANIAGNINVETHDESNIIVKAIAKGYLEKELDNVTYKLERSTDQPNTFFLNSYDNTPISKSILNYLFFWSKQPQKQSSNSLDFIVKVPQYFNQFTNDSAVQGDFSLLSAPILRASCICALKGRGGKISVNNLEGALDASTTNGSIVTNNICGLLELSTGQGNITVNKWSITSPRSVKNKLISEKGDIKVELPNNITVNIAKSTDVLYERKRYVSIPMMPFTKGGGLHELTISTPGKIELD